MSPVPAPSTGASPVLSDLPAPLPLQPDSTSPSAQGINPMVKRVLWIIPAVYFFFVTAEFLVMTRLAFHLTKTGYSALAVGVVVSAMWAGIFLSSLFAHRVVDRWGYGPTFLAGCVLATAAMGSMLTHALYWPWLLGSLLLGVAGGLAWVAGESWLAEAAPADRRGFYVGLFETSVGVGMIAGPAVMVLATAQNWEPLWIGVSVMMCATLSSLWLLPCSPPPHASLQNELSDGRLTSADWLPLALPLALIATASGLLESGSSALLPSLSLRLAFDVQQAALLGAVIGAGSALLQTPAGMLSDRWSVRRTLLLSWAILLLTTSSLWFWADHPQWVLWPVGFVLGGLGGAVYTLVVIELGHQLTGGALVRSMGLLVTTYTAGTAAGPALGGWLFDQGGLGLLAACLCGATVLGAAVAWRYGPKPPSAVEQARPASS